MLVRKVLDRVLCSQANDNPKPPTQAVSPQRYFKLYAVVCARNEVMFHSNCTEETRNMASMFLGSLMAPSGRIEEPFRLDFVELMPDMSERMLRVDYFYPEAT